MTKNKKFILILVAFILILAVIGVSFYFIYSRAGSSNSNNNNNTNLNANSVTNINSGNSNVNVSNENVNSNGNTNVPTGTNDEADVVALSRSFVERFGSFSNRDNFDNLKSLENYMTASLKKWAEKYMAGKTSDPEAAYYGITTKVVSFEVKSLGDKDALVSLQTQRKEMEEGAATNTYFQKIELNLKKVDSNWKVDKFKWL